MEKSGAGAPEGECEMSEAFVYSRGDLARLGARLRAAAGGKKTKIAFLGDSITAGSCAYESENRYTACVERWWAERFGEGSAEFKNAGIGATDSYLAVHRVSEDVFGFEPDVIFIEFINDADSDFYMTSMDSLLRRCLSQANCPAVVMIEMTQEDGTCPQRVHSVPGKLYGVPMLSYHDYILPEIAAGRAVWQDISPDNIHPNDKGHRLLGGLITGFLDSVADSAEDFGEVKPFDASVESPCGFKYAEAVLAGKGSSRIKVLAAEGFSGDTSLSGFTGGWRAENGGRLVIEAEFKNLGVLYGMITAGGSTAQVAVDGKPAGTLNADFPGGWGDYGKNEELAAFAEKATHTVEITISEGNPFEVLRLMLS